MPRKTRAGEGLPDRRGTGPRTKKGTTAPFVPTQKEREDVCLRSAWGWTYERICSKIKRNGEPISEDTLVRHFRQEIDKGVEYANAEIGSVLFEEAKKGNIRAIDSWFDRKGGQAWKRRTEQARTGADGGPIQYTNMTDEEIDRRLKQLQGEDDGTDTESRTED